VQCDGNIIYCDIYINDEAKLKGKLIKLRRKVTRAAIGRIRWRGG
jgi:hypothetical protein